MNDEKMEMFLSKNEDGLYLKLVEVAERTSNFDSIDRELIGELMNDYVNVYVVHYTLNSNNFFKNKINEQIEFILNPKNEKIILDCYMKMRNNFIECGEDETSGDDSSFFQDLITDKTLIL